MSLSSDFTNASLSTSGQPQWNASFSVPETWHNIFNHKLFGYADKFAKFWI